MLIFATGIVQLDYILNPKFTAPSHLICLYRLVFIGPVGKQNCWLFHAPVHIFETGNFYITPIVYKNFLFKSEPTIPLAFLIHEKKDQKFQERFLSVLIQECPNLKNKEIIFVADRERALTNAICEKLPAATVVYCWNHVKRDVKEWLKKRKALSDNIDEYMKNGHLIKMCF